MHSTAKLCLTLSNPMDHSRHVHLVHGISHSRHVHLVHAISGWESWSGCHLLLQGMSDPFRPDGPQPPCASCPWDFPQPPCSSCPWDFPGGIPGVGAISSSRGCLTLSDPMDHSRHVHLVHGISGAGILEWVPSPPPGDLPDPGTGPESPALAGGFFTTEPPGKPLSAGNGHHEAV